MLEDWQRDILIRDGLRAKTTFSYLANILYPDFLDSRAREDRLMEVPDMQRLLGELKRIAADCDREAGVPRS